MILRPCIHCFSDLRPKCPLNQSIRAKLKGLRLTVAAFKCQIIQDLLAPGTRVQATFEENVDTGRVDYNDGSPIYREGEKSTVEGTVMYFMPSGKVRVWLDQDIENWGSTRDIVKLWPSRLTILSQPPKQVCPECGRPEDRENRETWHCDACAGTNWQDPTAPRDIPF